MITQRTTWPATIGAPMALVKDELAEHELQAVLRAHQNPDRSVLVTDVLPLAPMQLGMLYHRLLDPTSSAYVGHVHLAIDGHVDPGLLRATCERLIERHEALRTAVMVDGVSKPVQVVLSTRAPALRLVDISGAPDADSAVRDAIAQDRAAGFDLARDVLLRMTLLERGGERQHLLICAHHIVLDGWSMGPASSTISSPSTAR